MTPDSKQITELCSRTGRPLHVWHQLIVGFGLFIEFVEQN